MAGEGGASKNRRSPCRRACPSPKASEDRVLPPPVGTVSENKPGGCEAALRQACSTSALRRLTSDGSAPADLRAEAASNSGRSEPSVGQSALPGETVGSKNASASRKSASNSVDANIRTHSPASAPFGIPVDGRGASRIEGGGLARSVRSKWDRSARRSLRPVLSPSPTQ